MNDYRDIVRLRANGHCERCGISIVNREADIHHRRPRGMGGTKDTTINTPENCVVLCRGCHSHLESCREQAAHHGWLVPRRNPEQPADVPVFVAGAWYRVTADALVPTDLTPPF